MRSPRVDREAEIVLGGMFGTPLGGTRPAIAAWKYLAKLYRQKGAQKQFDGVAAHPYGSKLDNVKIQLELLRDEMVAAGEGDADLWITEIGWASGGPPNPLNRGIQGQADRLREHLQLPQAQARQAQHSKRRLVLVARQFKSRGRPLRVVSEVGPVQ